MNSASSPKLELEKILPLAQLPGLPQSAVRVLELSQNPDNGPAEYAAPIEVDIGLTGQVLRLVNSSYFGFAREISSIKMAICMVGIRTIKNYVLWSAVYSLMAIPECGPFNFKTLWQDSLRRALFARILAGLLGAKDADDLFTAALLQDMAIPLLARESPSLYGQLLLSRNDGQIRLSALESRQFGWTHAQAAGMMARRWELPSDLIDLIESHTAIDQLAMEAQVDRKKLTVALSALLPTVADSEWTEYRQFESCYERIAPANHPAIAEMLGCIDNEYDLLAPILNLPKPAKSLVDCCNEAQQSQLSQAVE
jgi:HD-like signal output (HDOD) protein